MKRIRTTLLKEVVLISPSVERLAVRSFTGSLTAPRFHRRPYGYRCRYL
nr:MAG TPA: hypothetical protein [Caudoviricetes sp.]